MSGLAGYLDTAVESIVETSAELRTTHDAGRRQSLENRIAIFEDRLRDDIAGLREIAALVRKLTGTLK